LKLSLDGAKRADQVAFGRSCWITAEISRTGKFLSDGRNRDQLQEEMAAGLAHEMIGQILNELRLVGRRHDDSWRVIDLCESAGMDIDSPTTEDVQKTIPEALRKVLADPQVDECVALFDAAR
jgi:hypothetical protein